ncbi:ribonucleases P/MRP protein subunit POP1-domain-containing protein [Lineolata rhizophorae]|uniref:Ribonucleases P/MRP protein subunit POP1-domain-containing protein n=1 Tax=Lineolata rhizophorae TaxID=578093 RepID=A0A6A6NT95_9PEZI|nr:ribonucleases P/MRP protein subunit POP1-domain-containing protein [Lineolata rhizophorae]
MNSSSKPSPRPPPKRKSAGEPAASDHGRRKWQKIHDLRKIAAQTTDKAFAGGEIDVDKFINAREFEIKALETGLINSKKALNTRAFQEVPRDMKRRTGSHNVKRLPKRLRSRATAEMAEDNTPTKTSRTRKPSGHQRLRLAIAERLRSLNRKSKARLEDSKKPVEKQGLVITRQARIKTGTLQAPPREPSEFRRRQKNKTWLPTHLFHAKRAHMTPPENPLWGFAIPITPTIKCHRRTHRVGCTRGAIAWDTSYMSMIGLRGAEEALKDTLKTFGVGAADGERRLWGPPGRKWLNGTRIWEGWLQKSDPQSSAIIGPATIIWSAYTDTENRGQKFKRPGKLNLNGREQKGVFVRIHPSAFHQFWEELQYFTASRKSDVTVEDLRFEIGSIEITGPAACEALAGSLLPLQANEAESSSTSSPGAIWASFSSSRSFNNLPTRSLLSFNIRDPRLRMPPHVSKTVHVPDINDRDLHLLSQWPLDNMQLSHDIFDRESRQECSRALPSQKSINRRKSQAKPGSYPESLPTDPKIPILIYGDRKPGQSLLWTILLPWSCVRPVWYSIMAQPLSTGGTSFFGGLFEKRQIAFECGSPWFPGDFLGTNAGRVWSEWDAQERKQEPHNRSKAYRKLPKKENINSANRKSTCSGWGCDWEQLLRCLGVWKGTNSLPCQIPHDSLSNKSLSALPSISRFLDNALVAVKVFPVAKGIPVIGARIYRLANAEEYIKERGPNAKKVSGRSRSSIVNDNGLIETNALQDVDWIGFITSGGFNLKEGMGMGIGNVLLWRALWQDVDPADTKRTKQGTTVGAVQTHLIAICAGPCSARLARWEFV